MLGRKKIVVLFVLAVLAAIPTNAAVRLKTGKVTGPGGLHPRGLRRKTLNRSHYLVEMAAPADRETLAAWKRRGIRVSGVIPPSALILSVPDGATPAQPGLLWSARLGGADKMSPMVATAAE